MPEDWLTPTWPGNLGLTKGKLESLPAARGWRQGQFHTANQNVGGYVYLRTMTSPDDGEPIALYDEGLARRLKALACTAPLHELDGRKMRLEWCDAGVYQMAEIALQAID